MRSKYFFLAFLFLLVNTGNIICSQNLVYSGSNGTILFKSDAPLELISAKSDELKGALKLSDGTFAFTIDNRSFKGFNSPLQQEHFYENYIEADKFPSSTFVGKIIEPIDPQGKGEYAVRAKGILN
ncbi:MAG TPA: hypothetical protein VK994_00825, partial [Bacteroidales bacterium]|nr:hypothetical protein [Bacteroidales bacterium]